MYKDINDFSNTLKKKITGEFYQGKKVRELALEHELSINEILAILNSKSVDPKVLRKQLSTLDLNVDRFIVIADTHIGSTYQDFEFINYVYEYAKKQGITHILHAGDLIQSTIRPTNPKLRNETVQLNYLVDNYPDIDGITTHILLGNHDFHTLEKDDEYFKVIKSRKDFDILGFKRAYFTWNKYLLNIRHEISHYKLNIPNVDTELMLCGHRHEFNVHGADKVMVPCLCDEVKNYGTSLSLPGFIEVYRDKDKLKILAHSFNAENYKEKIFSTNDQIVEHAYSRKLINSFIIK